MSQEELKEVPPAGFAPTRPDFSFPVQAPGQAVPQLGSYTQQPIYVQEHPSDSVRYIPVQPMPSIQQNYPPAMRERAPLKPEAGKGEADKPPNVPSLLPPDMTASTHMVYQNVNIIHEEFMIEQFMKELDVKFAEVFDEILHTDDKPLEERFKYHELPLARIKKIMKSDEDVRMISAEAPVIFSKACLMFVLELSYRSWYHVATNKRRTLQKCDIAQAVTNTDIFDFLQDVVPREPEPQQPVAAPPSNMMSMPSNDHRFLFSSQQPSQSPFEDNYKHIPLSFEGSQDDLAAPLKDEPKEAPLPSASSAAGAPPPPK